MTKMIKAKYVGAVGLNDPDSGLRVEIEIFKLETGGMIGVDSSFLANTMEPVYSPFDEGVELELDVGNQENVLSIMLLSKKQSEMHDCGICKQDGWARDPREPEEVLCVACFEAAFPGKAFLGCHVSGCRKCCYNSAATPRGRGLDYFCDDHHKEHMRTPKDLTPWRRGLTATQIADMLRSNFFHPGV